MASPFSAADKLSTVQPGRIRVLKQGSMPSGPGAGPVVYWMFRDQRLRDNWALIHAVDQANKANVPVALAFNLFDQFLGAKARQLGFMLRGLRILHCDLEGTLQIPFFLFQVYTFETSASRFDFPFCLVAGELGKMKSLFVCLFFPCIIDLFVWHAIEKANLS